MSGVVRRGLLIAALLAGPGSAAAQEAPAALHTRLPKDPLVVFAVSSDELAGKLQGAAEWLARNEEGPQLPELFGGVDPGSGASLAHGLLATVGPELAIAIDLPPLDTIAAALQIGAGEAYAVALSRSGLLAEVRDEKRLHATLRALLESIAAPPAERDGVMLARIPLIDAAAPEDAEPWAILDLYYATRDGRLALGFTREWVLSGLADAASGERLAGGSDFRQVFANLDARPDSLAYVNLPKLRALIEGSQIVGALLEGNPETRRFVAPLRDPKVMASGLGSTSVAVAGGVRTTHFGPYWMSGTAASSSVLAALAVPSLLVAAERGRARETLGDIQIIAAACEDFATDARSYPGPTRGWVPIGEVSAFLEPIYIPTLPRTDAWDNPILYWSDGKSYKVLSTGADGRMDRDWRQVEEPTPSAQNPGDIVVADGRILALPSHLSD